MVWPISDYYVMASKSHFETYQLNNVYFYCNMLGLVKNEGLFHKPSGVREAFGKMELQIF